MWVLERIPLRQEYRDGRFAPSSPPHDRRHDRPQSVAGDATILHQRGFEVQPLFRQIVCALRFFYGVTLGEALIPERIPYALEPRKLPVVLSANEVVQFSRGRIQPEEPCR